MPVAICDASYFHKGLFPPMQWALVRLLSFVRTVAAVL